MTIKNLMCEPATNGISVKFIENLWSLSSRKKNNSESMNKERYIPGTST